MVLLTCTLQYQGGLQVRAPIPSAPNSVLAVRHHSDTSDGDGDDSADVAGKNEDDSHNNLMRRVVEPAAPTEGADPGPPPTEVHSYYHAQWTARKKQAMYHAAMYHHHNNLVPQYENEAAQAYRNGDNNGYESALDGAEHHNEQKAEHSAEFQTWNSAAHELHNKRPPLQSGE